MLILDSQTRRLGDQISLQAVDRRHLAAVPEKRLTVPFSLDISGIDFLKYPRPFVAVRHTLLCLAGKILSESQVRKCKCYFVNNNLRTIFRSYQLRASKFSQVTCRELFYNLKANT